MKFLVITLLVAVFDFLFLFFLFCSPSLFQTLSEHQCEGKKKLKNFLTCRNILGFRPCFPQILRSTYYYLARRMKKMFFTFGWYGWLRGFSAHADDRHSRCTRTPTQTRRDLSFQRRPIYVEPDGGYSWLVVELLRVD